MINWQTFDKLDRLFLIWAFTLQVILIVHFAVRKPFFDSYTLKYGWIVYALCIPAAGISVILLRGGKTISFWLGGLLFIAFAAFGFWADYLAGITFRTERHLPVLIPYILLYLSTVMFYWWPVGMLSKALWVIYGILFLIATVLNITSH
jgi:hypothetical protein